MPFDKVLYKELVGFGHRLLDTLDLDPIYVMVHKAELKPKQLRRWLLAYWLCYHAGVACKITESNDYYGTFWRFQDEKWPRGTERRHFRGTASEKTIKWFQDNFPEPADAVKCLYHCTTFPQVRDSVTKWPLFGPWISFKAADMLERVAGRQVSFSIDDLGFYKEPAAASDLINPGGTLKQTVERLLQEYSSREAPPGMDRPCHIQEVETCMCKGKSFLKGHYHVGKDIAEIRHSVRGWGNLAERMRKCLPPRVTCA